jgi:hypothetical protein
MKNWLVRRYSRDPLWFIKLCAVTLTIEALLVALSLYLQDHGTSLMEQLRLFVWR